MTGSPGGRCHVGVVTSSPALSERIEQALERGRCRAARMNDLAELVETPSRPQAAVVECAVLARRPLPRLGRISLVAVGAGDDRRLIRAALRSGANGYVAGDAIEEALVATLRAVLAGQFCFSTLLRRPILTEPLSFREREVIHLISLGLTNKQMARYLFLSESTVKSHVASAFKKLGVTSRAEAIEAVQDASAAGAWQTPPDLERASRARLVEVSGIGRGPDALPPRAFDRDTAVK